MFSWSYSSKGFCHCSLFTRFSGCPLSGLSIIWPLLTSINSFLTTLSTLYSSGQERDFQVGWKHTPVFLGFSVLVSQESPSQQLAQLITPLLRVIETYLVLSLSLGTWDSLCLEWHLLISSCCMCYHFFELPFLTSLS